ncbi:2OG-Fe(II) oxygenase [Pseudomonas sp. NPDC077186]|uniref:2OG-Fe(II) oxygenase n=1 Tax=Pseudomonas sp. NPDC077186 TaxID=3364421 RepID=UPI0037C73DBC
MSTPAQALSSLLATLGGADNFATRFTLQADPRLHIDGVGSVSLPISIHTAHRLCAVAQPAYHGYKDETRLDPRVRDTWEIPAGAIRFDSPQWASVLDQALLRTRRDLGLPSDVRLKAELHNLLVYAPGQFFAVHQDSEKAEGMLGTLVISLPSRFTGGEFVVSHQGQTLRARGSESRLSLIAFYADCHHEVRPVKQGYRVALTYNLIAQHQGPVAELPAEKIGALADAVHAFWHRPAPPLWPGDEAGESPDRLVYLLDHQYTQSGLSWTHLKGADALRVAALRKVAEQLDAEIFLALADVHETWSAEDDYQYYGHWDYADEEEDEAEDDTGDPILGELIDSEVELRHWLALDGEALASETANSVAHGELCLTRASADCTPFQSEHEGYMGNYGNTVDRWYHRAAVVLWPRQRAFVIRARQSPRWAIARIAERLAADDPAQALEWAQALLPIWHPGVARDYALLGDTLAVAAALDNEQAAAGLLAPFSLQQLTPPMSPWLLRLLERHGSPWCAERLRQWAGHDPASSGQLDWLAQTLPALTHAWSVAQVNDGSVLAATLLAERWNWLQTHLEQTLTQHTRPGALIQAVTDACGALLGLLRGGCDARRPELQQQIIDFLRSADLPLQMALGVLHAAAANLADAPNLGLAPLHAHCRQILTARLARPARAADDWSIPPPAECARIAELGPPLARFLSAPAQQRLEWPLAQSKRQLIHQLIERYELPVRHETRRSGRPYTLVLEKTPALFEREAAERLHWAGELDWLQQTADGFA